MRDSKNDQIPKDKEEAEKYYGDKTNTQRKEGELEKAKNNGDTNENLGENERTRSNVLTHPKDKKDESFDVDHNEKNSKKDK